MISIPTKLLRDGSLIPCVGMGTGIIRRRAKNRIQFLKLFAKEQIKNLVVRGYRKNNKYPILRDTIRDKKLPLIFDYFLNEYSPCYFDTARAYGFSEGVLGDILTKKIIDRNSVYIVSKIRNIDQSKRLEEECVRESLSNLKIDYLDLLLIHWPQTDTFVNSYRKALELQKIGLTKGVGVANFNIHHIEELLSNGLPLPLVNEVECHPYYQQKELVDYCNKYRIQVIAYTPTGRKIKEFSRMREVKLMCKKYNAQPVEIIMSWHILRGIIPVFSTTKKEHVKENVRRFVNDPIRFTEEELAFLASLDRGEKYFPDPDNCDFSKL